MSTRSGFLFPRSSNGILRRLRAVIRTVFRPKPASIGRNREIADELFETRVVLDKTEIELIDA